MTLLEYLEDFERSKKDLPLLRDIANQLRTVLARVYLIQTAINRRQSGETETVEFPFSELLTTVTLIDTLIADAFENIEVPYEFIVRLRETQRQLRTFRLLKELFTARERRKEALVNVFSPSPRSRKVYQVQQGDTLMGIAERFLKDFNRWPELVALNNLDYPYIITEEGVTVPAGKTILTAGNFLILPLDALDVGNDVLAQTPTDYASILGVDIFRSHDGRLRFDESGDFITVSGVPNLNDALIRRLKTAEGELPLHPEYGSKLDQFIGQEATDFNVAMTGMETWRTVVEDPRISKVINLAVAFEATVVDVTFDAYVIGQETPAPLNLVLPK